MRWPREKLAFVGIDPPESVTPRSELEQGERERGWGLWREDFYGVAGALGGKRVARGWGLEGYQGEVDEVVRGLLEWRGGESGVEIYGGALPWDGEHSGKGIQNGNIIFHY